MCVNADVVGRAAVVTGRPLRVGSLASVLSRHTGYDAAVARAQVRAAAQATRTCGDSCAEHASMHEHCRICAQACRETEQALNALFVVLQPTGDAPGRPSATAPQQRA